jgi:hypothetical protein
MNFNLIKTEEHIRVDSWEKVVKEIDHPNLLYAPLETIDQTFQLIQSRPNEKFVVVSACSDFGLEYQNENPINKDLRKVNNFIRWEEIERIEDQYVHLTIPSAIYSNCRIQDRISVKMYAFTNFTFNQKPPNLVKWFCTNCNVQESGIEWIPFGVNNDGNGSSLIEGNFGRPKKYLMYINLQTPTLERANLKAFYGEVIDKDKWPLKTLVYRPKPNIPVAEYLKEVAESEFVLSPRGNGLDCYRVLECIYAGSVPIMEDSRFSLNYIKNGLPVLLVSNLFGLTTELLGEAQAKMNEIRFNYDAVKLSYWRSILENSAKELD